MDFNPTSHGVSDSVAPKGGPPQKKRVIFDPMLLYSICYLAFLGVTCKTSARNLKILAKFQNFKSMWNCDFTSPLQMKIDTVPEQSQKYKIAQISSFSEQESS